MNKILIFCFIIVFIGLFLVAFYTSKYKKFNKADWNSFSEGYYDKREPILEDLLANYHLKGKNIKQLRTLLGSDDLEVSEYRGGLIIQMNIVTDYGFNIDPQYTKDLYLYLNKDSVVTSYEVTEHHSK